MPWICIIVKFDRNVFKYFVDFKTGFKKVFNFFNSIRQETFVKY